MTEDNDEQQFLMEYEFVEVEPNKMQYIWEADGEELCLISLELKDGYIEKAYFIGTMTPISDFLYCMSLDVSFKLGVLWTSYTEHEGEKMYTANGYSVIESTDDNHYLIGAIYSE